MSAVAERREESQDAANRDDPARLEEGIVPASADNAQADQNAGGRDGDPVRPILRRIVQYVCMSGHPDRLEVRYPIRFIIALSVVTLMAIAWLLNFFAMVNPLIEENDTEGVCRYSLNQLKYNARVLFAYFVWFSIARSCLFVPFILARVAVVQSRTHGFCTTYCVHLLIRDGPIYIFVVGSMLFWFNILRSPMCADRNPHEYHVLKMYAVFSCLLAAGCVLVVYWHNRLIAMTLDFRVWIPEASRRAPPETIIKLETVQYDESIFGDEEGKLYPSECAICLSRWEPDENIKVTPCWHAFHEECIAGWLQSARTCALCRKDLVVLTSQPQSPAEAGDRPSARVQIFGVSSQAQPTSSEVVVVSSPQQRSSTE
mmetsp:Transcript_5741/g.10329  ORF Transcript_5741/g.10329 Transcript_5741/m.10329 type:complete len:372 (+) Transcript_5741:115-1230(+)